MSDLPSATAESSITSEVLPDAPETPPSEATAVEAKAVEIPKAEVQAAEVAKADVEEAPKAPPPTVDVANALKSAVAGEPRAGRPAAKAAESEARRTFEAMKDERERERPPLEAGRVLRDVTELFTPGMPQLDAAVEDIKSWVTHLRRERVLVLASASADVLEAAVFGITKSDQLGTHTRKLKLQLGKTPTSPDNFELCCLPDTDNGDLAVDVLLIVEATHNLARDFLDDLFRDPVTQRPRHAKTLTHLSRQVLVLTTSQLLGERNRGFGHGSNSLPCINLPFHRQLIAHVFASEDDATRERFVAAFEAQREAGVWGATEQLQYENFHSRHIGHTLRAELEASAFGVPSEPVTIGSDALVGTLLFVACFMNDLTPQDFQIVLLQLLGSDLDPTWEGSTAGGPARTLKQRWAAQNQALLASAGLTIGPSTKLKGKQQLLFTDGNLDARKTAFRSQQFFLLESCRHKLEQSNLLFDARATLAEAFSGFLAESAAEDQSFDDAWVFDVLAPALADGLTPAVAGARLEAAKRLLRDLLAKGCAGLVKGYFERLCRAGRHDVVLQLGQRLASANDFDELSWLKRCFDQGTSEVAERAYARLLSLALRPGTRTLERIRDWLKTPATAPSRSHLALLRLCVELSELPIWAPSLAALLAGHAPSLKEPAALLVVLELSFSHHVEATLNEQGRWLFELKKLIDVWFVTEPIAELLAEGANLLRFHLLGVWLQASSHDRGIPPHLGVLQAILLAGAALCLPVDERAHLGRETQRLLATLPRQQRDTVELRLRAIERCLNEVAVWLERSSAATTHDRVLRERWRTLRAALAEQRAAISAFRASKWPPPHQPRNLENAQSD